MNNIQEPLSLHYFDRARVWICRLSHHSHCASCHHRSGRGEGKFVEIGANFLHRNGNPGWQAGGNQHSESLQRIIRVTPRHIESPARKHHHDRK
jgi:hypothetical protein